MITSILDRFAYLVFARCSAYTPALHYDLRRQIRALHPELMLCGELAYSYWLSRIYVRCDDFYSWVHGLLFPMAED